MSQEVPSLTPDGHVVFTSSEALAGALPAIRAGTLVVRAAGLTRGQIFSVELSGGGMTGKVSTRATVVSEMGNQVLLHLLDMTPQLIAAALNPTREMRVVAAPLVTDEMLENARTMLLEAQERMARLTQAMKDPAIVSAAETMSTTGGSPIMVRTPVSTPVLAKDAAAHVLVHASGHLEFESAADLASRVDRIARNGSVVAEWTGAGTPAWTRGIFLMHARNHPAAVDVSGELVPMSDGRCSVIFRDRQELACAMQGLKQALAMPSGPVVSTPQLARLDDGLCVEFGSVAAVMAALPVLFGVGRMRARWLGIAPPPKGIVELHISLPPLPERGVLHGSIDDVTGRIATITLDAREDARSLLNAWLSDVRQRTAPRLRALRGDGNQ